MNDKQVIKKLIILKSIEPDDETLRLIRKRISPPVSIISFDFTKWFIKKPLISVFALASVVIIFTATVFLFSNFLDKTILYAKITFASNHYEKAKIALSNVQNQVDSFQKNLPNNTKIKELSSSLALANQEMSGLQLIGEKGKYTSYQCEELYESYHKDLQTIEDTIDQTNNNQGKALISQAKQYDKEAAMKLEKYRNNKWQNSEIK